MKNFTWHLETDYTVVKIIVTADDVEEALALASGDLKPPLIEMMEDMDVEVEELD